MNPQPDLSPFTAYTIAQARAATQEPLGLKKSSITAPSEPKSVDQGQNVVLVEAGRHGVEVADVREQ